MKLMADTSVPVQTDFNQLYDSHVKGVYGFIYFRTGHRETAEDLTAQTFLKGLENWPRFRPGRASFKTWIYTVARNTVIDYHRTDRPHGALDENAPDTQPDNAHDELEAATNLLEAQKYLAQLKADEREIVMMRVWDELSYKEIAEISGKSEAAAKMMFSRTIKKLRDNLPLATFIVFLISERINI